MSNHKVANATIESDRADHELVSEAVQRLAHTRCRPRVRHLADATECTNDHAGLHVRRGHGLIDSADDAARDLLPPSSEELRVPERLDEDKFATPNDRIPDLVRHRRQRLNA